MTTPAITERNRINAQSSTGPRTPEGKLKVSQNARRLGLFVSDATVEIENPEEFAEILAGYIAEYCPNGFLEIELVRQLATTTQRLRRLDRIENAALFRDAVPHTRHEANVLLLEGFESLRTSTADHLIRARAQAERAFNRAYRALEARLERRHAHRIPPAEIEIQQDTRHLPFRFAARTGAAMAAGQTSQTAAETNTPDIAPVEIFPTEASSLAENVKLQNKPREAASTRNSPTLIT